MSANHPGDPRPFPKPSFPINPTLGVFLLALLIGLWALFYRCTECDIGIYWQYVESYHKGSLEGLYADNQIEYPPLAVLLMLATDAVARALPDCSPLGSVFVQYRVPAPFVNFKFAYRLEMALVTAATLMLLLVLLRRLQPDETRSERGERLLTYVLSLAILSQVAFDRLDLLLGSLMLLSLGLLLCARTPAWALLVLALGIAYKIVPAALAPIWVLGSIPVAVLAGRATPGGWRRLLLSIGGRGALLVALTGLCFLPFYLLVGPRCLLFLEYHKERGIEIESTYATLLGLLKNTTGYEIVARSGHGGVEVISSLSPLLTQLAPVVLGLLLVGAASLLLATVARRAATGAHGTAAPACVAAANRAEFTGHALLAVLIFLLANKVFSPQFALWLMPLVPLVPLARWPRRLFQAGYLGACLVTYFIYPHYLEKALYGKPLAGGDCAGPTAFGTFLLAVRTVLLLGLISGLTVHLMRRYRQNTAAPGEVIREGRPAQAA